MAETTWLSLRKLGTWKCQGEWWAELNNALKCLDWALRQAPVLLPVAALLESLHFIPLLFFWCLSILLSPSIVVAREKVACLVNLGTTLVGILQTTMKWRNHWTNWHYLDNFPFYFKPFNTSFLLWKSNYSKKPNSKWQKSVWEEAWCLTEGLIWLSSPLRMEQKHSEWTHFS